MHGMLGDSDRFQVSPPSVLAATSPSPPRSTRLLRWLLVVCGVFAVAFLIWRVMVPRPADLGVIIVVLLAAELLLSVRINQQRTLSLSSTFTFLALLIFGPLIATIAHVAARLMAQVVERAKPIGIRRQPGAIISDAIQQLISGLVGGTTIWLILDSSLFQPPTDPVLGLILYAFSYLACHVVLTSILRSRAATPTEPTSYPASEADFWDMSAFVLSIPLAVFVASLHSRFGFTVDVLLAFIVLAAISYIIRLHLHLDAAALESKVLNEISHSLSGSTEINKLYPAIYSKVRQVIPVDVFLIGLLNETQTELDIPFLIENGQLMAPQSVPIEQTLANHVLRDGKPLYLAHGTDQITHLRFGQPNKRSVSAMFVPLCLGNDAIGIISVQSYTADAYTQQQLNLLDAISRIAAVAINNARLFAREKEVLRGREEFVSLVAHELKNPLAALLGHAQILERRVRDAEEKLRRPVGIIQAQGERMNRLVEDLLDLSRVDTGRLALHLQRIDLGSLARDVVEQHRILTTQHQLTIETEGSRPVIEGDVMRLTQVLQNLLTNAIKYSPGGGQVKVHIETRCADDPRWPPRLSKTIMTAAYWEVVQVSDQGIGVPPDQLGHIFERFYRANNIAQLDVAGTGLGLSICDALIRSHGGVIWVESEWGSGSTFTFILPVPEQELQALPDDRHS